MDIRIAFTSLFTALALVGASLTSVTAANAAESSAAVSASKTTANEIATEAIPGTNTVVTDAGSRSVSITLPGVISSSDQPAPNNIPSGLFAGKGGPVLSTSLEEASISSYATGKGTQTLINIASITAAHAYRFPLSLPSETKATMEDDGSVVVRTTAGEFVGGYRAPWAYDSVGNPVPTRFAIDGNTLVQTIDFNQSTVFPVTADPSDFWGWTVCIATVTSEIAANIWVAGKIQKLIARFGSIQRAFETFFRAWNSASSWERKQNALVKVGGTLALEIVGINHIKAACFDS